MLREWRMLKGTFQLFGLFLLLVLFGCSQEASDTSTTEITDSDDPWLQVVHSHSSGQISRFGHIEVRFNQDLSKEVSADFLKLQPAISGQGQLVNKRLYRFIPNAPMPSGQKYQGSLPAAALGFVQDEYGDFQFDFQIIEQAFELKIDGLQANDDDTMKLIGQLTTADGATQQEVSEVLSATYEGKGLAVQWDQNENGKVRAFSIENIQRTPSLNQLLVSWDGTGLGVAEQGKRSFDVPAIGQFVISSLFAVQGADQTIEINFSEALQKDQDIRGLVQLSRGTFKAKIRGAKLTLYPNTALSGDVEVSLDAAIKNAAGFRLGSAVNKTLNFLSKKPAVRFVGKGTILPVSDKLSVPFEAVNVDSIQVTAFQIFENNMPQFFQENDIDDHYSIRRVGRYLWRKTVQLKSPVQDNWNRFNLDVKDLVSQHPGSLFRFELSINRANSIYACSQDDNQVEVVKESPFINYEARGQVESSGWDGIQSYYVASGGKWKDRSNPCKDRYYSSNSNTTDQRNFMASNIGLVAKFGEDNKLIVVATQINNGAPLGDAQIDVRNYQNQVINSAQTNSSGFAEFELDSSPFLVVAKSDPDVGYLKVNKALAISTSHFNVGGTKVKDGVKAQLYAERGVWRPGDKIFLTFVVEDKNEAIPDSHPAMLELFNPKGQRVQVQVNGNPVGGFYSFTLQTQEDDMTGNWKAVASLGSLKFTKKLKIETVKPNHLKMKLDLASEDVRVHKVRKNASDAMLTGDFFSQWLHGAKASGLKGDLALKMRAQKTRFDSYADFHFDDPAREFSSRQQEITKFKLDEDGKASIDAPIHISSSPPGKLRGALTSRVFEASGDFSISKQNIDIHPYINYVGMQMPKGDAARGMLLTDQKHKIDLLVLDTDGTKAMGSQKLELTLYKLSWKWWWDTKGDRLASYVSRYSTKHLQQESIEIENGQGQWEFEVKYPAWGRYMLRACDQQGQHCTGKVFYMDWPGWAGREQKKKGLGANMLTLSSDKDAYKVGDTAVVSLPESQTGRALVSIENGSRVIDYYWAKLSETGSQLQIPITQQMTPNVYISVSVIQPHENKSNDEPIRLMGILPITVSDPATHLSPTIDVVGEVEPETTLRVEVAEKSAREFTYTLAIVDEGLLGLTQFRTPDLHKTFYKKEALGVQTWDLFDHVVGAYGAELEQLLAVGGDGSLADKERDSENRRFPPVVKFMGPFHLEAGKTAQHDIEVPQYLGAVRVMLVAGEKGAYGKAEKEVLVRKPLNVLATLPRVLGKDETLQMPITLFTTQDDINNVTIRVKADDKITLLKNELSVSFNKAGEEMIFVPLRANSIGQSRVEITAQSGKYSATQVIHIPVNTQTKPEKRFQQGKIKPGETWQSVADIFGISGTQKVALEMTMMPPMNLQNRLDYLLRFPHGCVEQTTSRALPQLFLPGLSNLSAEQLQTSQDNVAAAIEKLRRYQTASGGFSYWPGHGHIHDWSSSYAGHFLILAKDYGYDVPQDMINAWLVHQKRAARAWTTGSHKEQAYRLFTLALSGNDELGAMNRMRQGQDLQNLSRWLLAASYELAGQRRIALDMAATANAEVAEYQTTDATFGSTLRDEAMMLMSLMVLRDTERAKQMVEKISSAIRDDQRYYSTQTTAFSLLAMAQYGKTVQGLEESNVALNWQGKDSQLRLAKPINLYALDITSQEEALTIENQGSLPVYASVMSQGVPELGEEKPYASELAMEVRYFNKDNKEVNLKELTQGEDIRVAISVTNRSTHKLDYLALTYRVASGFEIRTDSDEGENNHLYDYQDVRDDRIFTYLKLAKAETKVIEYQLNASYQGRYYQPAVEVSDMYEQTRAARNTGHWIDIVR